MRKISKEEAGMFTIKRGTSSVVRTAVMHLKPGEILFVGKKDWKQKNGLGQMLTRLKKRTGMEFRCDIIASGEGWLVERVK